MSRHEPDSTQTIAVLEKNTRETVHVRIFEYHGRQFVDLRVFSGNGDQPLPTKKGLAFPVEQALALIEALERIGDAVAGAEDDRLTKQYRATMAGGSQPGEVDEDRAGEPNTIVAAG